MRLTGTCNQCGLCCLEGSARCINLEILAPLGTPGATRCKVYKERYPGLPIVMIDNGKIVAIAACAHGSSMDDEIIIQKGIGKGCSLKVVKS